MSRIWMDIEEILTWGVINPRKFCCNDHVVVNEKKGIIGKNTSLHKGIGSCERSYEVHFENGENKWIDESKIKHDK